MNDKRNAHDHLDALLTGLEDEVICGEGIQATDVQTMRAELEELIMRHTVESVEANTVPGKKGAESKSTNPKELIRRFAGFVQRAVRNSPFPRVRMAFSSKRDLSDDRTRTKFRNDKDSGKLDG